ncbi:MAG: UvrD-helicase domain-containing protein [Clostridia bacterium]|nr:UvrD-helicase domain-containing protein [Clostridia bacterium]
MFDDSKFNEGQRQALYADGNVLVSASAGSGKTTVLTERIMRLIADGHDVRRIAVMTFSRAAAAEMKSRIVKKLYDLMREGTYPEIYAQLENFPFASIGTIDGFCYALVKKYFAVVGADPAASPLEPEEGDRMLSESFDIACEEVLRSGDERFVRFAERYAGTRRLDEVKRLVTALRTFLSVQPEPEAVLALDAERLCGEYFLTYVKKRIAKVAESLAALSPSAERIGDNEKETVDRMRRNLALLAEVDSVEELFSRSSFLVAESVTRKQKDRTGAPIEPWIKEEYKVAFAEYKGLKQTLDDYAGAYLDDYGKRYAALDAAVLKRLTERTEELYAEKKKRAGKLDFVDMSRLAREILIKNESVAKEVRESYDYIFVDEYQDTNYLQEELFSLLSDGNNVYVVGDVKQSIYHFRSAEPQIFVNRKNDFEVFGTGTNVYMNDNYRSHPDVLRFVNEFCSEVMTEEFCQVDYRRDDLMKAGGTFLPDEDAVRVYLYDKEEKPCACGVYSVRDGETEGDDDLETALVCDLVRQELGAEVYDAKEKTFFRVGYKDVAVLTGTNKRCAEIAAALSSRGIPASVADGDDGVYAPRELLVDFLRLSVGSEDVALVNAALSGMFGLTKKELVLIRANSPKTSLSVALSLYDGDPIIKEKVISLLQYLTGLKEEARYRRASEVMQKVLSDGLDACLTALGGDAVTRVRRFVSDASGLECDVDIGDFLEYYDASYKGDKPILREDSVTVMTVHKSKGLEFPIVVIPSIHKKRVGTGDRSTKLYADRDLGIALKSADFESGKSSDNFATKVIRLKKNAEERREMARCAYVAFTRAKNRLLIVGERGKACTDVDAAASFRDLMSYALERNPTLRRYERAIPDFAAPEEEKVAEKTAGIDLIDPDFAYPFERATTAPAKTTVSELMQKEDGAVRRFDPEGGKGEAEVGTAYHLVLQKIPLPASDEEKIRACVAELVENKEIDVAVAERLSTKKIYDLLQTDIMQKAAKSRILREQPFVMPLRSDHALTLVQGVIDLLVFEEDGVTVVDYKASGKDKDALVGTYAGQLDLYARAARGIFGVRVKEKVLLNVLRGYEVRL